ncbi:MAG: hypothetical protein HY459_04270 [Parcubacteria group bacterium]|nr:hypothetical protein [Parcubacteria group bacterium]
MPFQLNPFPTPSLPEQKEGESQSLPAPKIDALLGRASDEPLKSDTPFSFQTSAHLHRPADTRWLLWFYLVMIAVTAFWILTREYLAALTFAVLTVTVAIVKQAKPEAMTVKITEEGVWRDGALIPFNKVKTFAIVGPSHDARLTIEVDRFFTPTVTIPLPRDAIEKVRSLLRTYVAEDETREESVLERLERFLGF